MNEYELVLIIDPNLGEDKIAALLLKVEDRIKHLGGELQKTDKWGIRRLAHPLQNAKKLQQAYYTIIYFKSASALPGEISGYLKVTENILRYSVGRAKAQPLAEIEGKPVEVKEAESIKGAEAVGQP